MSKLKIISQWIAFLSPFLLSALNWYTKNVIAGIIVALIDGAVIFFLIWYFVKHDRDTSKDKLIEQIQNNHRTEIASRNEMIEQWKKYADVKKSKGTESRISNPLEN